MSSWSNEPSFLLPQCPEQLWFLAFLNFGFLRFSFSFMSYSASFQRVFSLLLKKLKMICVVCNQRTLTDIYPHPSEGICSSACFAIVFVGMWPLPHQTTIVFWGPVGEVRLESILMISVCVGAWTDLITEVTRNWTLWSQEGWEWGWGNLTRARQRVPILDKSVEVQECAPVLLEIEAHC